MKRIRSICVFCASSESIDEVYRETAADLGRRVGAMGIDLVYGGAAIGLMGCVARGVHENNGRVVGVLPEFFKKKDTNKNGIDTNFSLGKKTLIMIFEKPSTRTRLSFELAMKQLGGQILVLNPKESHYGNGGESIHDTAKVLSQYGDIVMMRTHKHKNFLEFSKHLEIPIING